MDYNLEERTLNFSKNILSYCCSINRSFENSNIISQLLKSSSSIGANYREANSASSKNDFRNKISISRKEVNETKYWIELLAVVNGNEKHRLRIFWKEAHELSLIFNKIFHTLKNKN